jgi:Ala-tRNA(Pro) deacylase
VRDDADDKEVRMTTTAITAALDDAGVEYELLPHAHTDTAQAEAAALGVSPEEVAKTLVVTTPAGYLRAVLPASERIDLRKLAELHGDRKKQVHLATEDDLSRDYPDFELGAVPPFGGGGQDEVVVDTRLARRDSVLLEAGSHATSIRLKASDLIRVANAQVADISRDD